MSGTIEVRRTRPLLGTLVEIAVHGGPREQLMTAIDGPSLRSNVCTD